MDSTGDASKYRRQWQIISVILVALVFLILAVRQHRFVNSYSVNVMFYDQWDFYTPLFQGRGWWATFDLQHGPHRQGVGFLLTRVLAEESHWNSRWDAFGVSFVLIAAAAAALPLAWLCGVRQLVMLVVIPMLYLNIRQYEDFVGTPNISHGAMPILMFTLYGLAWFVRSNGLRLILLSILTFGCTFTGFGIFVGLLTPVVLLIELAQAIGARRAGWATMVVGGLIANAITWVMFSRNYHFAPAVAGFRFPYEKPLEYFYFVAIMLDSFFVSVGHTPLDVAVGLAIFGFLGFVCVVHGWRIIRGGVLNQRPSVVIFCLSAYALIYSANTAVGRVFLNWRIQSQASRYVTLEITAGLAIFLHIATLKSNRLALGLTAFYILLLAIGTTTLHKGDWKLVHWFHDGRQAWKGAYLATHDELKANAAANFPVYPVPNTITDRLHYLEEHHLNLFYQPGQN